MGTTVALLSVRSWAKPPDVGRFTTHRGRRCKPKSTLFSRHPGKRCRPAVRVPRLAFPVLAAVMLTAGCQFGPSGVSTSHPSPQMPPPAYGEYVPYRPDSEASINRPADGVLMFNTDPGVTSAILMLVLLGEWFIIPTLGACVVDRLRRRPRRVEAVRR